MGKILVYNNGLPVAQTSKAINTIKKDELMRERTLTFTLNNRDNARKYAIDSSAIFEYEGQKYDLETYNQNSGANNTTTFTANHILSHANRYKIAKDYNYNSLSGSLYGVIVDMIVKSGADTEGFWIGSCADIPITTLSLGNKGEIGLLTALYKLCSLGCEIEFDNYTINAPVRIGADTGKVFKFGRDLINLDRKFDKTTNPWTTSYTVSIANLQRLPGGSPGDEFEKGDTVGIIDETIGDTISDKRIIAYYKCDDDPTKDTITIGQFIRDTADDVKAMQVEIDETTSVANNSVQIGTSYNSVNISHEKGFDSVSGSGATEVFMNGTDGFCGLHNEILKIQFEPLTGKFVGYNSSHTQKVELGGTYGITFWKKSGSSWVQTGGMDIDANLLASRLSMIGREYFYAIVGKGPGADDGCGLFLVDEENVGTTPFFGIWHASNGNVVLQKKQAGDIVLADNNGVGVNAYGTVPVGAYNLQFKNGMLTSLPSGTMGWSGTLTENGYIKTFVSGALTSVVPV